MSDSPRAGETDVHLYVSMHGVDFDYAVCESAAKMFLTEQRDRHYVDRAILLPGDTGDLPRLPNERLYLGP